MDKDDDAFALRQRAKARSRAVDEAELAAGRIGPEAPSERNAALAGQLIPGQAGAVLKFGPASNLDVDLASGLDRDPRSGVQDLFAIEAPDSPALTAAEVAEIVRLAADEERLVLVGGQAIAAWVRVLNHAAADFRPFAPYTSADIDFLGSGAAARRLAARIDGRLRLATLGDVSPNAATVVYDRRGRAIVIDILASLYGVPQDALDAVRLSVAFPEIDAQGPDKAAGAGLEIAVLHPVSLLWSKIANVCGALNRRDPGAVRQMRACPVIVREYLRLRLDNPTRASQREACDTVVRLARVAGTRFADDAFRQFGIDLPGILTAVADHPAWDPRFCAHQVIGQAGRLAVARDRRIQEVIRKGGA